jgi:hypothetical protein
MVRNEMHANRTRRLRSNQQTKIVYVFPSSVRSTCCEARTFSTTHDPVGVFEPHSAQPKASKDQLSLLRYEPPPPIHCLSMMSSSHINHETGEPVGGGAGGGRSQRFSLWLAFLVFSSVVLGSAVDLVRRLVSARQQRLPSGRQWFRMQRERRAVRE